MWPVASPDAWKGTTALGGRDRQGAKENTLATLFLKRKIFNKRLIRSALLLIRSRLGLNRSSIKTLASFYPNPTAVCCSELRRAGAEKATKHASFPTVTHIYIYIYIWAAPLHIDARGSNTSGST